MARYYLAIHAVHDSDEPLYSWVYSERHLERAVEITQSKGTVIVAYSPTTLHMEGLTLRRLRDKLLRVTVVVASPNNCFCEADTLLRLHGERFRNCCGLQADLLDADAIIAAIEQNRADGRKTVLTHTNRAWRLGT